MSISGKSKTEATYRAVNLDSSSSLKEFSMDRKKYYRKYIQGENIEDADNKAATIGRVVETLLLEPEEFDGRFFMSSCVKAPTGMMLDFVEALYKHTKEATDDSGNVTRPFDEICKDAHVDSGFKIKLDAVLAKFVGTDNEVYYKEIREVRSKGLTVVTTQDVTNAENIVEELKQNFATKDVVNLVNSARYTINNQMQVEGYSVDGQLFKSMMDKVVVDHNERTIQVYDLKCTWSVENFYEEYYLYRRAYIQAYLYMKACESLTFQGELQGYHVLAPKFIVCDSTNYYNPLVYTLAGEDLHAAYVGFEHKGRKYPGVKQLIEDLRWAIENDKWNISRENYLNNGQVNVKGGN
jgi:hypothetical protein